MAPLVKPAIMRLIGLAYSDLLSPIHSLILTNDL